MAIQSMKSGVAGSGGRGPCCWGPSGMDSLTRLPGSVSCSQPSELSAAAGAAFLGAGTGTSGCGAPWGQQRCSGFVPQGTAALCTLASLPPHPLLSPHPHPLLSSTVILLLTLRVSFSGDPTCCTTWPRAVGRLLQVLKIPGAALRRLFLRSCRHSYNRGQS